MKKRGLGVGSMFYGIGYGFNRPDIGAAHVEIAEDGTATLYSGVCDLGQGIQTLLAQIVVTELGVPMNEVRVVNADTGSTPDSGPTSGSRATFVQGQAVRHACLDFVEHGSRDAGKIERARFGEREPCRRQKLFVLEFLEFVDDGARVDHEETRIETARAIGRRHGAGDDLELVEPRHDLVREEFLPRRRARPWHRLAPFTQKDSRLLEGFADRG